MGFGSLLRSNSQSERHGRRSSIARPVTYYGGSVDPRAQAYSADKQAETRYEARHSLIMKDERDRSARNQTDCKYRTDRADSKLRQERERLDNYLAYQTDLAKQQYRAGYINAKELDKIRQKLKKRTDMEWKSFSQWHQDQLGSAQKVLYARGDQIGAETGAAIRRAKGDLEAAKRHSRW